MGSMKRLLELVKPHWKLVLTAVFAGAIVSATNGALAWVVGDIVDDVFIAGSKEMLRQEFNILHQEICQC